MHQLILNDYDFNFQLTIEKNPGLLELEYTKKFD